MSRATVIIGAGYGDEGKGLATDFFAASHGNDALTIRFNGGAQAGHTVHANGERHVFSHFGSGSLAGAATYLSRFFVCHPMLFQHERRALAALGLRPRVMIDPTAPVTVPYDIMINQQLEASRGGGRHGSCGVGFGETIERTEQGFSLQVRDLTDPARLTQRLVAIRDDYVPRRAQFLGLPPLSADLGDDRIVDRFVQDAQEFIEHVQPCSIRQAIAGHEVIFEGAQGLLLDMDRGAFPHVTRSNTGLKNVVHLAEEARIGTLDVCYVSRTYMTRHGAGPLAHELPRKPWDGIVDRTNARNAWQGALRFAWLDLDRLSRAVRADLGDAAHLVARSNLLLTCLDQAPDQVTFIEGGRLQRACADELLRRASRGVDDDVLAGFGPSRNDILVFERRRSAA